MSNTKTKAPSRAPKYADDVRLRVLKPNPHKPNSIDARDFDAIVDGGTVGDALKRGSKRSYVNYAIARGLVEVATGEAAKPKRQPRTKKAATARRPRRVAGAEARAAV